jgi:hypothetical protein
MEPTERPNETLFATEYNEMMKGFQYPSIPGHPVPEWSNPSDFIVKFSLYQESPGSITSTETSITLNGW